MVYVELQVMINKSDKFKSQSKLVKDKETKMSHSVADTLAEAEEYVAKYSAGVTVTEGSKPMAGP